MHIINGWLSWFWFILIQDPEDGRDAGYKPTYRQSK